MSKILSSNNIANKEKIGTMLNPNSIAVIGASPIEGSIGYTLLENLIQSPFKGKVFAVNPFYDEIQGGKSYDSVLDVEDALDLAVIATPADVVGDILKECGKKGISSAIILSAGFNEAGEEGKQLYDEITTICEELGIRAVGPNCMGMINPWLDLNIGFYSRNALPGNLALISQSGSLSATVLDWAVDQNIGFSGFVSIGSMVDVDFADLIEYYEQDDKTECILVYIESLKNGIRFMEVASRVAPKKPIIAVRAGRSTQGAIVAASHTGALAANDMVYDAAFEKAGILRVDTIAELFHVAKAFSCQPFPKGESLAIVSNAGGPAVIATDAVVNKNIPLATLSDETKDYLSKILPSHARGKNPIDVLANASAETFCNAVTATAKDENVDGIIAIFATQGVSDPAECAKLLAKSQAQIDKPIIACWMGEADVKDARDILETAGIPNYRYPESSVNVFHKMLEYNRFHYVEEVEGVEETEETEEIVLPTYDTELAKTIIQYAGVQDRERLTEIEAKQILNCYQIATPKSQIALDVQQAEYSAVQIGFPVVMKVVSPDIGHKIDVGGVILNIKDYKEAEYAYNDIMYHMKDQAPDAEVMGVMVEQMISKKYELLIGAVRDKVFGPVIMFGMGGSLVQLWNDAQMAIAPLTRDDACDLIKKTKAHTLISGFRGMPAIDKEQLVDVLVNFSHLINDLDNVVEVDINPFGMDEDGGVALDAHMLIK